MAHKYSEMFDCTLAEAKDSIDKVITLITLGLIEDGKVNLQWFGTFYLKNFRAHKGYDFKDKKQIDLPSRKVVKFRPSQSLRYDVLK